jgi:LPS O-antigen subunit length determinant protein (WzzB/FepE family)
MQYFLTTNREYTHSTVLTFEHDRLQASVNRYERVYDGLTQALEQARIDEIRDTPVITILQHPNTPLIPNSRGTVMRLLISIVLGSIVGVIVALFTEYENRGRAGVDPRLEFRRLFGDVFASIRHGRLIHAAFGRDAPAA